MMTNRAFGKTLTSLDIAIVDDKRGMTTILRALLNSFGLQRIRMFENPEKALGELQDDVPDLIITRDRMQPVDGASFIRLIRQDRVVPLCFAAVIMVSASPDRRILEMALKAGAHQLLCLPVSAQTLYQRIKWLTQDDRGFEKESGRYVIDGVSELLERCSEKDSAPGGEGIMQKETAIPVMADLATQSSLCDEVEDIWEL